MRRLLRGLTMASLAAFTVACGAEPPTGPSDLVVGAETSLLASSAFVDNSAPTPFGRYNGVEFYRYTGRFVGTTAQGDFRVPYEIVVPSHPDRGNGTVLVEPPHFALGPAARDAFLGRGFLFNRGFSYAAVGWSFFGNSILDPSATDAVIAGGSDDEIVVQFIHALGSDPYPAGILPELERYYSYGYSQTSFLMHRILRSPAGQGLLDMTMLNATWWPAAGLSGTFTPVSGVGKVVVVQSEGDLILSDAEQLRDAAVHPDYRIYEVAGAAHIPEVPAIVDNLPPAIGTNPVDWPAVARAAFVAGDAWARGRSMPPPSRLVAVDGSGDPDPVYGFPTGIARDGNLNALGGVRLPDVELGTAQFIPADFGAPIPGLLGATVDLACSPLPGGGGRFMNHGAYVEGHAAIVNQLKAAGYLVQADARRMKNVAARTELGMLASCGG